MTPAAQFAQKREEAIALIRAHAPVRLQDSLIDLLRPAIALSATRADDAQILLGASKFGGAPDVPADFQWPLWNDKPLGFLAQINLKEVGPFDVEELLPKSGLLLFFHRQDDVSGEQIGQVHHFESRVLHRAFIPEKLILPDIEVTLIPSQCIEFSTEWTVREFHWTEIEGIWDYNAYVDQFLPAFGRTKSVHRVLGEPKVIHDYMFEYAEMERSGLSYQGNEKSIEEGAKDWHLLLQLDFQESDCYFAFCYFLILKDDLAAQRFDKARCFYQGD